MSFKSITSNPPANFSPSVDIPNTEQPFRFWCQKVLPLVYDDSLSYYELLCKVVDYLNTTMENVNTLGKDVDNINKAYNQLQDYVNNYFSTLDVQEEINNKLNVMASDGTLSRIIAPLVTAYNNVLVVDDISKMTDITRLYLNTSDNYLYYYNGTNWVSTNISYGNLNGYYKINGHKVTNSDDDFNELTNNGVYVWTIKELPKNAPSDEILNLTATVIVNSDNTIGHVMSQIIKTQTDEYYRLGVIQNDYSVSFQEYHVDILDFKITTSDDDFNALTKNGTYIWLLKELPKNAPSNNILGYTATIIVNNTGYPSNVATQTIITDKEVFYRIGFVENDLSVTFQKYTNHRYPTYKVTTADDDFNDLTENGEYLWLINELPKNTPSDNLKGLTATVIVSSDNTIGHVMTQIIKTQTDEYFRVGVIQDDYSVSFQEYHADVCAYKLTTSNDDFNALTNNGTYIWLLKELPKNAPTDDILGLTATIIVNSTGYPSNVASQTIITQKGIFYRIGFIESDGNITFQEYNSSITNEPRVLVINKDDNLYEKLLTKRTGYTYYIHGDHNIYEEILAYDDKYFDEWNATKVGIKLYGNHYIFDSNSVITLTIPDEKIAFYQSLAGFNMTVNDTVIENLNIEVTNVRYCIHDELGGENDSYKHTFINCHMKNNSLLNWTYRQCIGGGLGNNGYIDVRGGFYEMYIKPSVVIPTQYDYDDCISYHNSISENAKSNINVSNCYFKSNRNKTTFRAGYYGSSALITECLINNNSFDIEPILKAENETALIENMKITSYCNEIRNNN